MDTSKEEQFLKDLMEQAKASGDPELMDLVTNSGLFEDLAELKELEGG